MQFTPPILKHIEGFRVIGLSTRTQNSDEFTEQTAKIPSLWQQFSATDLATHANLFGVYSDYESNAMGLFTVTVGIASDAPPAPFNSARIQTGNYLVFQGAGPMPTSVIATWKRIWDYFEEEKASQRNFISDFEAYNGSDEVAIYIGIK
ncbi:MAG: effector binding domain-containing protein [Tatlockia sp.]|jgi:predicted transcriptional regulator YdeE